MCHYDRLNSKETQHSRKVSTRRLPYPTHFFRPRTSPKGNQTKGIFIPSALQVFYKGEESLGYNAAKHRLPLPCWAQNYAYPLPLNPKSRKIRPIELQNPTLIITSCRLFFWACSCLFFGECVVPTRSEVGWWQIHSGALASVYFTVVDHLEVAHEGGRLGYWKLWWYVVLKGWVEGQYMLFWEVSRIFSQFNVSSSACRRVGGTPQRGQFMLAKFNKGKLLQVYGNSYIIY